MKKLLLLAFSLLTIFSMALAQTKQEKAVSDAVEQLRKAMVEADSLMLDKLTAPQLSYGHSGGHIDDR